MDVRLEWGATPEQLAMLYADPLIQRTGDDMHPASPVSHDLARYASVYLNGAFVGAYLVIEFSAYEWEVHTLLQKAATPASRAAGRKLLGLLFEDPDKQRVTGWVRADLKTATNLCGKLGLLVEGVKSDAVRVNGRPVDLVIMGLTRERWESMQ